MAFGSKSMMIATSAGVGLGIMLAMSTSSDKLKTVFSALTGVMIGLTVAQWAWNAAKAFGLTLTGAGIALVAAAGVAAAAVGGYATHYMTKQASQGDRLAESVEGLGDKVNGIEKGTIDLTVQVIVPFNIQSMTLENVDLVEEQVTRRLESSLNQLGRRLGWGK